MVPHQQLIKIPVWAFAITRLLCDPDPFTCRHSKFSGPAPRKLYGDKSKQGTKYYPKHIKSIFTVTLISLADGNTIFWGRISPGCWPLLLKI